ncbi:chromosome segregation protein Csm1/Pcs1-domain-containing protein [Aspergillus granulosus]|uniref:Chromosome segregation protein Csm1/Pcs1-domain-containing protein n=1 Tax=Aspergillus granulosus TaxID=176169 RepID=A0ABR4H628_9EURO
MPKRKAATARLSGLIGSDDEGVEQPGAAAQDHNERPTKKARGRPRSKSAEMKAPAQPNAGPTAATAQETEAPSGRSTRRGRPKGSRNSGQIAAQDATENQDAPTQETGGDEEEISAPRPAAKSTRATKAASTRGKKKGAAEKQIKADGEFEYTPKKSARQQKKIETPEEQPESAGRTQRKSVSGANQSTSHLENTVQEVVEETFIGEEIPATQPASVSPAKGRPSSLRASQGSPSKRKSGGEDDKTGSEPELRRRLGDLTKKYDTLENRYRNLKDIGVVEANANVEKLKKQCESMTTASNNLITSLKAELETQKALGQKSRLLQKQLRERDAELAKLTSEAEQSTSQLTAAQNEVKALQTKLAAARNTAATLEHSALKAPGSAIKNSGTNRANAAAAAEAAQVAQLAQLKEDLYSDLTGLIIRDVKQRNEDNLYDCIQTGVNGTLHFKLAVPHVSSANFETAEFQYVPLLDENRDRELVATLPEYLTVDITFVRQQASKFYTRVIDALTKRRASQGN